MIERKHDRRWQRTRQLLFTTFTELLREQNYDDMSVQDIVERANVGRSTFYAHFLDKDDLLVQSFERVLDALMQELGNEAHTGLLLNSTALFEHIQSHHIYYRALLHSRGPDLILRKGQAYVEQFVLQRLHAMPTTSQEAAIPLAIQARLVSGSLFVLLQWWIDNKMPYPPERMNAIFQQFVQSGVQLS